MAIHLDVYRRHHTACQCVIRTAEQSGGELLAKQTVRMSK